ncbi:LOW QUALITY PROTEIN: hypothetical protein KUTeg_018452 [Tegillarca granosa]|uniref:Uncharacterized protein n=1 Tax=Tegillarca granosa TaxID=220873 RepID=A0ABQ9EHW8_TEGGR|nr:LOW QUALITY PROTEIN: hypothetical protein KUTeg_018452 [Tegillarca granosa]
MAATDVSICENELVYARVVVAFVPTHIYIKNQDVEHLHALGMSRIGIVKHNLLQQDGASVNLGKNHSVTTLLKNEISHLIAVHCVYHRLALGATDAMKDRECKLFSDLKSVLIHLQKHYKI